MLFDHPGILFFTKTLSIPKKSQKIVVLRIIKIAFALTLSLLIVSRLVLLRKATNPERAFVINNISFDIVIVHLGVSVIDREYCFPSNVCRLARLRAPNDYHRRHPFQTPTTTGHSLEMSTSKSTITSSGRIL
ncbi:hypothetical protein B0J11DRAFT_43249 [Dendryphion nanum]|uniref:Uncharacterized protein n=1 Tax=Dendryphion nanum TaxID=256645 RepID=A0A9P9EL37_9PLEO|nr:hypothetical protein B0J11DRAFT_43249 [Dendryphion nanum]